MPDDLARTFAFVLRADMCGTRVEPFSHGTAVFTPELPLRHDGNYMLVDPVPPDVDAAALAAEADEIQGGAGLGHRCLMVNDAAGGERLAPGFESLGWQCFRGVVMALRRPPEKSADTSGVVPTDLDALREAKRADILSYPWSTPEVADQLLQSRDHAPVPTEYFAVFEDGEPVSWAELYVEDGVAQVEAVATVERCRNRGLATAVVLRCIAEARARGADLVFLCADADDWPTDLYRRLGFDEIGRYMKFTRT